MAWAKPTRRFAGIFCRVSARTHLFRFAGHAASLVAIAVVWIGVAEAQVTTNVLGRVLHVRSAQKVCSAFTIDLDQVQYLVTARHCIVDPSRSEPIEVRIGDKWKPIAGPVILPRVGKVDIAALRLPAPLTVTFELSATSDEIQIGQPVYFLGYPSGLSTKWKAADTQQAHELAFVKAGILSAMDSRDADTVVLYVDGHNNPGFSGGPIVFRPKPGAPFRVAAVVSAYRGEGAKVVKKAAVTDPDAPAYDDLYAQANAGIVVGYAIETLVSMIQPTTVPASPGK